MLREPSRDGPRSAMPPPPLIRITSAGTLIFHFAPIKLAPVSKLHIRKCIQGDVILTKSRPEIKARVWRNVGESYAGKVVAKWLCTANVEADTVH